MPGQLRWPSIKEDTFGKMFLKSGAKRCLVKNVRAEHQMVMQYRSHEWRLRELNPFRQCTSKLAGICHLPTISRVRLNSMVLIWAGAGVRSSISLMLLCHPGLQFLFHHSHSKQVSWSDECPLPDSKSTSYSLWLNLLALIPTIWSSTQRTVIVIRACLEAANWKNTIVNRPIFTQLINWLDGFKKTTKPTSGLIYQHPQFGR